MDIVDTHCHASVTWYEPIESLVHQMDSNGVGYAVLVQHMGQYDNDYLFGCVRRFPGRFVPLVLVNTHRVDAGDELERLAEGGARGVRLRAYTRSAGEDPFAIWRKASKLGLPVGCGGGKEAFLVESFMGIIK